MIPSDMEARGSGVAGVAAISAAAPSNNSTLPPSGENWVPSGVLGKGSDDRRALAVVCAAGPLRAGRTLKSTARGDEVLREIVGRGRLEPARDAHDRLILLGRGIDKIGIRNRNCAGILLKDSA